MKNKQRKAEILLLFLFLAIHLVAPLEMLLGRLSTRWRHGVAGSGPALAKMFLSPASLFG